MAAVKPVSSPPNQHQTLQEPYFGRSHAMFTKDVFRVMKADHTIKKSSLVKKPAGEQTLLKYKSNQFKTRSQLIMENYERPHLTEDQHYLIDKVVRQRGKEGRFGVDHSEILNIELELANKPRDHHMNQLVYKTKNPYREQEQQGLVLPQSVVDMETSQILFKRLSQKGQINRSSRCSLLESSKASSSYRSLHTNREAPTFQQWVRAKDAERRLKKKLVSECKREIRSELLEYAKKEQCLHESRVEKMEKWLSKKKLDEAYSITQMRDVNRQEEIKAEAQRELAEGRRGKKSYKKWLVQKKNQERIDESEKVAAAHAQMEEHQYEEAKLGIQNQIEALNGSQQDAIFSQEREHGFEEDY